MNKHYSTLFSQAGNKLKASEIRELLKLLDNPEMISFAGGLPNPDAFPIEKLKPVVEHVMQKHAKDALQYGPTEGHNKLRAAIAHGMHNQYSIKQDIQNIIITNGSQQALNLLCKILLDPGDIVLTSSPTYLGAILTFNSYQAQIESVSSDDEGIQIPLLEEKLKQLQKQNKMPKFIYLIPTFQNPTGVTIPKYKREQIYDLISKYDLLLVEDDPYGLLRYQGNNEPLIKKYDTEDRIIYLGTFSKILAPGFRIAWMAAPKEIIQKITLAKQAQDLCTNTFGQYCVFEAIHHNILFPHIKDIIKLYKQKRDSMIKAMKKHFPKKELKWNEPHGGLFIWVRLPDFIDSFEMLSKAISHNVAYVIGAPFFPNGGGHNTLRLNFSYASDKEISTGIKKLGEVIKEEIDLKQNNNIEKDKLSII